MRALNVHIDDINLPKGSITEQLTLSAADYGKETKNVSPHSCKSEVDKGLSCGVPESSWHVLLVLLLVT